MSVHLRDKTKTVLDKKKTTTKRRKETRYMYGSTSNEMERSLTLQCVPYAHHDYFKYFFPCTLHRIICIYIYNDIYNIIHIYIYIEADTTYESEIITIL